MADLVPEFSIEGLEVDDAVIKGTASSAKISQVTISQLDIRGADLQALTLSDTVIITLIAEKTTRVPPSFPNPVLIQNERAREEIETIADPVAIAAWLDSHGRVIGVASAQRNLIPADLENHPLYRLIERACRIRQYWIRSDSDEIGGRIVGDPMWETLADILEKRSFLRRETDRQASGRASIFYHIKRPEALLEADPQNSVVAGVYNDIVEIIRRWHQGAADGQSRH